MSRLHLFDWDNGYVIDVICGKNTFPGHPLLDSFLAFMNSKSTSQWSMNDIDIGPDFYASLRQATWIKFMALRQAASLAILRMVVTYHF